MGRRDKEVYAFEVAMYFTRVDVCLFTAFCESKLFESCGKSPFLVTLYNLAFGGSQSLIMGLFWTCSREFNLTPVEAILRLFAGASVK